jgi:hypothetical protein
MGFEKGHPKFGGKPKGYKDETKKEALELFYSTLEKEIEHLSPLFQKLREENPIKYLEVFAKYCSYFVPKQRAVDQNQVIKVRIGEEPLIIDWSNEVDEKEEPSKIT